MIHIAVDPGSTHLGKKEYAKELIRVAVDAGANSVKFQLFKVGQVDPRNVPLNRDLFTEMVWYGKEQDIEVTASAFDQDALDLLMGLPVKYIKFAYSKRHWYEAIRGCLKMGRPVVVSTDAMSEYPIASHLTKLYVDQIHGTSVYPVPWVTAFSSLFPSPFDGYSDHHLGYDYALEAIRAGATWVEKHITLDYGDCTAVPDGKIALRPHELKRFVQEVKRFQT